MKTERDVQSHSVIVRVRVRLCYSESECDESESEWVFLDQEVNTHFHSINRRSVAEGATPNEFCDPPSEFHSHAKQVSEVRSCERASSTGTQTARERDESE